MSDDLIAALKGAQVGANVLNVAKIDRFCTPEQRAAIIDARQRGISHRTIANILTDNGVPITEKAVATWLDRNLPKTP